MNGQKVLEFHGTAGGYFVVFLVNLLLGWIPVLGWAFVLNYTSEWMMENTAVNGSKVVYKASFGESAKFMLVNGLLLLITFGIYVFWFTPKMYRYIMDHTQYVTAELSNGLPAQPTQAPTNPVSQGL